MLAMSATTIPLGRVPLLQAVDADSSEPGRIRSTELAPTAPPVCLPNRKGVLFIVRLLELRAIMRFIAEENQTGPCDTHGPRVQKHYPWSAPSSDRGQNLICRMKNLKKIFKRKKVRRATIQLL